MKPKKRTRNRIETRRAILDAAFSEFQAHGFHASSVDAILEQTQLTKGALFHQFASKLELGYAVVDEVIAPMTDARWIAPLAAFENPLQGILHELRTNIADAPQAMLNLGCPLNNLIQEMANSDREFRRRLRRVLETWIDGIEAHVKRGQRSGHVPRSIDARELAEYVVLSLEGVFGIIKVMGDKSVLPSLTKAMETYFASVCEDPTRRAPRRGPH
jgi:TetR/AcrR family transcriptional regulator, transcriptional repressor for nem operon